MNAVTATKAMPTALQMIPWRWISLGLITYFLVLLATFPAARLTSRLQTKGIAVSGVSGSIWNGRAAAVQANGITLGPTSWEVNVWRLFIASLSVEIHSKRDDGYIDATVSTGFSGAVTLRNVRGTLPVSALSNLGLPGGGTNGWSGFVQLKLDRLSLANRWPTEINGTIEAVNLVGPPTQPTQLGGYRLTFPAPNSNAPAGELRGAVVSMDDAPLDVAGTVRLTANRNYVIDAQVATRPSAPASIIKALQYLGPPDTQGKRPLSIAGSL
jgi:general secretion pathway protein N